ncbi:MAG: S41 family peptidase [Chloroflexi bacterium]|nr:S41 family peptidase [Chloroflexota bacterium]
MLMRAIKLTVVAFLLAGVASTSYFAGLENGRKSASASVSVPVSANQTQEGQPSEFGVFWEAWQLVNKEYLNSSAIDSTKMTYGAVKGMIEALDDPYTSFATPQHAAINEADMKGSFDGIGVEVELRDNKLTVVSPLDESPGAKAGIKPGDVIAKVDDKKTADLSLLEAVSLIRGPRGSTVTLTIIREGESDPLIIQVVRAEIKSVRVRSRMLDGGIAYVKLNGFATPSAGDLSQAVKTLMQQKPKGLILDLRNNPGGLLYSAVDVASIFLREGVVLHEESRDGSSTPFKVKKGAIAADVPMAVLINKGSASASEIVAGALQDSGRAVLIGENSFGKDTVQNVHELSDKSSLRITIARWRTPNKQEIHEVGLRPDIEVKYTVEDMQAGLDTQLDKAEEYLRTKAASAANP